MPKNNLGTLTPAISSQWTKVTTKTKAYHIQDI